MRYVKVIIHRIDNYLCAIACFSVFVCMALVTIHVLMRIILGSPIPGLIDYVGLITVVTTVFAIPWVEMQKGHIRVELAKEYLPAKLYRPLFILLDVLTTALIIIIVWRFVLYSLSTYQVGSTTPVVFVPFWPLVMVASLGMFFFFLTCLINFIEEIHSWRQKEGES